MLMMVKKFGWLRVVYS